MSDNRPPDNGSQQNASQHPQPVIKATYSGPLPPAAELERYNQVHPNAAEIILNTFQKESQHRQQLENRQHELDRYYVKKAANLSLLGTWLGFGIGIAVLTLSGYFAYLGHAKTGAGLAVAVIAGLVGTFVYGTTQKDSQQNDQQKNK